MAPVASVVIDRERKHTASYWYPLGAIVKRSRQVALTTGSMHCVRVLLLRGQRMNVSVVLALGLLATTACSGSQGRRDDESPSAMRIDSTRRDTTAASTDDCVRGEPEPVLAATGRLRAPRFERTGRLSATEDVQVDDTTSLRITHGGCAHYTETYAFTVSGATRDSADADYWLERAAALLRSLPAAENRTSQIAALATTLGAEAAKPDPYAYGEPISIPELTTVTVSVTRKAGDAVLEIIYDVAL